MHGLLAHADLIVSRSGGNAISEIAKYHKPSILIPLSTAANNEQLHNALELHKAGAAEVIEESELSPSILIGKITFVLDNSELRAKMSRSVSAFYQENASRDIAQLLSSLDLSKTQKD
jgi:UDP-N-acetylglucosamine--N-acetylmuramyl-(pentapeptide) pyrophosphoryl-undecaprenol N-acetylglucosamine transferase